ncbi:MAG: hypothetical protein AB8W37_08780 [Arsenophonus endosymbiont of Dermacentor nuttalli]
MERQINGLDSVDQCDGRSTNDIRTYTNCIDIAKAEVKKIHYFLKNLISTNDTVTAEVRSIISRIAKTTGEAVGGAVGSSAGVISPPAALVIAAAGGFIGSMAVGAVVEKVLGDQFQEMHISTDKMLSELESADKNLVLR